MNELLSRIHKVFKIVLRDDDIEITETTCSDDVNGWNSLQHINILAMLEEEFQIEFTADQIASMESVGDMLRVIKSLL
ncbi:MAG: acyl carrier protein [Lachnospiraceae bacterium]|nr:acyl carrier protein [Lachnospiraceae bacterium]